jgi:hypothetical protein
VKILKLSAKNVKRLRAVEVTPDGNLIIVSGKNGAGKSSLLDSIAYALGGKDAICTEPLRRGTKSGEVICDLGEMIVRRTFTAGGGGSLIVEGKDGARMASPQGKLDDLIGRLSFDPLAFSRMNGLAQFETLRELVGLDFSALDSEASRVFAERTDTNRTVKALEARLGSLPPLHEDAPVAEVASTSILAEIEQAQAVNDKRPTALAGVVVLQAAHRSANEALIAGGLRCAQMRLEIDALMARLKTEQSALESARVAAGVAEKKASDALVAANAMPTIDLAPFKARLAGLESANRKVRENQARVTLAAELAAKAREAAKLTKRLGAIEEGKQEAITAAQFPVPGLAFDVAGSVTFGRIPFEQASSAEQLRVSVAIGLALNPKLRVLLIRDGSLLDEDSLRLIGEMAEKADAQLWIERVEDGGATVIIEDGSIVGQES